MRAESPRACACFAVAYGPDSAVQTVCNLHDAVTRLSKKTITILRLLSAITHIPGQGMSFPSKDAPAPTTAPIPASVTELVRRIVEKSRAGETTPSSSAAPPGSEQIIADAELDGVRYLLVRMRKESREQVTLSPRELEIVRMVAQGHPNRIIGDVLNISSWTVATHLRRIFAKLHVGSRAAMIARIHDLTVLRE